MSGAWQKLPVIACGLAAAAPSATSPGISASAASNLLAYSSFPERSAPLPDAQAESHFTVLSAETARYRAILEEVPSLRGCFNWTSATCDDEGRMRVPAANKTGTALVIYPGLTPLGPAVPAYFECESNLIHLRGLSSRPPARLEPHLTPFHRVLAEVAPEFMRAPGSGVYAEAEWASSALQAYTQASEGKGILASLRKQYEYLQSVGIMEPVDGERLDHLLMTRILVESPPYYYGQAVAELSGGNLQAVREWLPGNREFRGLCDKISRAAAAIEQDDDTRKLEEKLRSCRAPDYEAIALNPQQYQQGITDLTLSEFVIGYIQGRMLLAVILSTEGRSLFTDSGDWSAARLAFQNAWKNAPAYTLLPPVEGGSEAARVQRLELFRRCLDLARSAQMHGEIAELAAAADNSAP